jgi:beta-glucosidase
VRFLDIGPAFFGADGSLSRQLMPDLVHLSEAGYAIWAAAIRQPLQDMLGVPAAKTP